MNTKNLTNLLNKMNRYRPLDKEQIRALNMFGPLMLLKEVP